MRTYKISRDIELLLGSIGAAQALYMTIQVFFEKQNNKQNLILGFFFLAVTIRIIKSLLWVYLDSVPSWFLNLGFITHSASGPLLFLYTYTYIHNKKWAVYNFFHFVPSFLLLFLIFSITLENFWYLGGYSILLFHQLIYSLVTLAIFLSALCARKEKQTSLQLKEWIWIGILVIGTLALQAAYFSNYILNLTPYLLGPIIYVVFIYFLSFFGLKNPQVFYRKLHPQKYQNIRLTNLELEAYKKALQVFMDQQKPYRDTNCSLKQIAQQFKLQPYLLSHIINKGFSQHFSDFINCYRIKEATDLLKDNNYSHLKIASIAYDCGFNSLSSFNAAFKKHIGMTPSAYRVDTIL